MNNNSGISNVPSSPQQGKGRTLAPLNSGKASPLEPLKPLGKMDPLLSKPTTLGPISGVQGTNGSNIPSPINLNKYSNDPLAQKNSYSNASSTSPINSTKEVRQNTHDLAPLKDKKNPTHSHGGSIVSDLSENQSVFQQSVKENPVIFNGISQQKQTQTRPQSQSPPPPQSPNQQTYTDTNNQIKTTTNQTSTTKTQKVSQIQEIKQEEGPPPTYSKSLTSSGITVFSCERHAERLAKNVFVEKNQDFPNIFRLGCSYCASSYGGDRARYEDFPEIIGILRDELEGNFSGNSNNKQYQIEDPFKDAQRAINRQVSSLIEECVFLSKYFESQAANLRTILEDRKLREEELNNQKKSDASKPDPQAKNLLTLLDEFQSVPNFREQQKKLEEISRSFIYSEKSQKYFYRSQAFDDSDQGDVLPTEEKGLLKQITALSGTLDRHLNLLNEKDHAGLRKRDLDNEQEITSLLQDLADIESGNSALANKDPFGPLKQSRFKVTESDLKFIKQSLGPKYDGLKLIFRASRDGFDRFRQYCQGKKNTLILIQAQAKIKYPAPKGAKDDEYTEAYGGSSGGGEGEEQIQTLRTIGAFTTLTWQCDGEYQADTARQSFLFTLSSEQRRNDINIRYENELKEDLKEGEERVKLDLQEGQERYAIRGFTDDSDLLFAFGSGYDIILAKEKAFYQNVSNLGQSYQVPSFRGQNLFSFGSNQAQSFFFGGMDILDHRQMEIHTNSFSVKNYQVYQVKEVHDALSVASASLNTSPQGQNYQ